MKRSRARTVRIRRAARGLGAALLCLALAVGAGRGAEQPAVSVRADREMPVYKVGETVAFQVTFAGEGTPELTYALRLNDFEVVAEGQVALKEGQASVEYVWERPGALLAVVRGRGLRTPVLAGAVCEPEKIGRSSPKPDDFDEFWQAKKRLVEAIPFNAELTPVPECTDERTETFALALDGPGGTKVRGYLSKPRGDGPFPLVMTVYGAGVFSVGPGDSWGFARRGAMAVNINPHDILNGQPREYYNALRNGPLRDYMHQGRDDREKSYFLRMFCACYQAARYAASRPEWDGKRFAVWGSSQGGGLAIVTAYLSTAVTAVAANVPALCDHTATLARRAPGWPAWVARQDPAQLAAARYYDIVNFAQSVRARALVCVGLIDQTCPPSAVYAAYNGLKGPKEMVVTPLHGHAFSPAWNEAKEAFLRAELGLR